MSIAQKLASARGFASLLLALAGGLTSAQTLFNASERAMAGEPIRLVGDGVAQGDVVVHRVLSDGTTGPDLLCVVQSRSDSIVLANTPPTLEGGLWEVFVRNGATKSNSVFVNRTRAVMADTDETGSGDEVSLYGHNLVSTTNKAGSVSFVAPDGTRFPATVVGAAEHVLTFLTPAGLAPGTKYRLVVTNNEGPAGLSESTSPASILATTLTGGRDLAINAAWSRAFNKLPAYSNLMTDPRLKVRAIGDGVADDTAALQECMDLVSRNGGGLVVIPPGTYNVDAPARPGTSSSLVLPANVVLKGSGSSTILRFGMRYTPTNAPGQEFWLQVDWPGLSAITNLTIQNRNTNARPNNTIVRGAPWVPMDRVAFKYVTFDMGNGLAMSFEGATHLAIEDCSFTCTSLYSSPFYFPSCRWLTMRNLNVRYRAGRIWVQSCEDSQIQDSVFERDMNYAVPGLMESGGLETSFGQRLVVRNNQVTGAGPVSKKGGVDGEMILSQNSDIPDFNYVGTASWATPSSLTDMNADWAPYPSWQASRGSNRMVVAITSGRGLGQWRFAKYVAGMSVIVDAPWQVMPDSTSGYTITGLSNYQQFIMNNTITNGCAAVVFYNGAIDSLIYQNVGINAGPIALRGENSPIAYPAGSNYRNELCWYNQVAGNYLDNSNAFTPAAITIQTIVPGRYVPTSTTLGAEVRNNLIVVRCGFYTYQTEGAGYDGYWNVGIVYNGTLNPLGNLGSVFSRNGSNFLRSYNTVGATSHTFQK